VNRSRQPQCFGLKGSGMNTRKTSRRKALAQAGLLAGAAVLSENIGRSQPSTKPNRPESRRPFRYCLNTATIRGQKLGIIKEIEVTAQTGYDAIEPWADAIQEYVKNGGTAIDLRKRISDSGLTVESAIGFPE